MEKPTLTYFLVTVLVANFLVIASGAVVSWSSPVLPKLSKPGEDNPLSHPLTKDESAWIGAGTMLGSILGPSLTSLGAAKIGRKWTLVALAFPILIALFALAFGNNAIVYCVARFVAGITVGGSFTIMPTYLGEISDKKHRGKAGSTMKTSSVVGIFLAYAIGPYLSVMWFSLALTVPVFIFLFIFPFFMPETPHYLLSKGREDEARKILTRLRGGILNLDEFQEIKDVVKADSKVSFKDVFQHKLTFKALILTSTLLALQQLAGVNIVLAYAQTILDGADSSLPADVSAIIMGAAQVLGACIAPIFVDRYGRKVFIVASAVGMFVADAVLGVYFYIDDLKKVSWLPTLCLVLYLFAYSYGIGPLPWVLMAELLPTNVKARATAIASTICWTVAYAVTQLYPFVSDGIGMYGVFWFFAFINLITVPFTIFIIPETKGKSAKELESILDK